MGLAVSTSLSSDGVNTSNVGAYNIAPCSGAARVKIPDLGQVLYSGSSVVRASVSKTECRGFDSLPVCQLGVLVDGLRGYPVMSKE